jgi:hypothetical protein
MAVTSLGLDVLRAMVQRVIDEAEGGDLNYAEIIQLCIVAGPKLTEQVADLVDLEYVRRQVAAQSLTWLLQPATREEAIAVLDEADCPLAKLAVLESEEIIAGRDARHLVRAILDIDRLVYQMPLGIGFGLFIDDLLERMVSSLLDLVVEWAKIEQSEWVHSLFLDIYPCEASRIAIERLIATDRLPEVVVSLVGQEKLDQIKSTASRPVIALRCAILDEEYEERRGNGNHADQRQGQLVAV